MRSFLVVFFCIPLALFGQGIQFEKIDKWSDVLELSEREAKPIFMDVYTVWCRPCKMLDKKVFVDKALGDHFNKNYINVKINAERGEGRTIAKRYGVRAYPTMMWIDHKGNILKTRKGFVPATTLLKDSETVDEEYLPTKEQLSQAASPVLSNYVWYILAVVGLVIVLLVLNKARQSKKRLV